MADIIVLLKTKALKVGSNAVVAFVDEFPVLRSKFNPGAEADPGIGSDSDNDSDFDNDPDTSGLDPFGCAKITPEVEEMVENTHELCHPLSDIYGSESADLIKEIVTTANEETQCAGLHLFSSLTPGEDRDLIQTCAVVSYWCCCQSIKKISPILQEALMSYYY
jgi:hypothetical protein